MHLLQLLRSGESWNGVTAQFAEDCGVFGLRELFALLLALAGVRATRVARYLPGTTVMVEVTGSLNGPVGGLPTVGDRR